MANLQHPLRLGMVIWFGSLEYMSLVIEYDMVLLPPKHLADAQEQPNFCPRPLCRRRQRRNNRNRNAGSTPCPFNAPGLTNDTDSLMRDLTNVSITPGASTATKGVPALTVLAAPPMVW
jgi:hypothetical protein